MKSGDSQLFNGEGLVSIRPISAEIWPRQGSVTQNQTGRSVSVTLYARRYSNLRPSVATRQTPFQGVIVPEGTTLYYEVRTTTLFPGVRVLLKVPRSTTLLKTTKWRGCPKHRQTLKMSTATTIRNHPKMPETHPTQNHPKPPKLHPILSVFTFCRLVGCRSDDGVGCRSDGGRWDPPPKGGGSAPHRIDSRPHHRIDSRPDDKT